MMGNERPIEVESISVKQTEERDAACISNDSFFRSTPSGGIVAGESSRMQIKGRKALFALLLGGVPSSCGWMATASRLDAALPHADEH